MSSFTLIKTKLTELFQRSILKKKNFPQFTILASPKEYVRLLLSFGYCNQISQTQSDPIKYLL
jgi:hypothetical protein